jgi:hypothetical protein
MTSPVKGLVFNGQIKDVEMLSIGRIMDCAKAKVLAHSAATGASSKSAATSNAGSMFFIRGWTNQFPR